MEVCTPSANIRLPLPAKGKPVAPATIKPGVPRKRTTSRLPEMCLSEIDNILAEGEEALERLTSTSAECSSTASCLSPTTNSEPRKKKMPSWMTSSAPSNKNPDPTLASPRSSSASPALTHNKNERQLDPATPAAPSRRKRKRPLPGSEEGAVLPVVVRHRDADSFARECAVISNLAADRQQTGLCWGFACERRAVSKNLCKSCYMKANRYKKKMEREIERKRRRLQ